MQNNFLSSFTPSLMSSQDLEAIFVQREELIEDLMASVRESATTKNKHYRLLIGMRGIGKTHTIALLYHRLKETAELQDKLLIAWLKEEEWGVSSWLDLQIRIFQALANSYSQKYRERLATDVGALYQLSPEEATARGEIILKEFLGDRTLLILTENFDEILKGLGDTGQKKLRAYLQNNSFITIVATAQNLSNDLKSKKKAFYGFFNTNSLDKLSLSEATNLLTKIAQLQKDAELTKFIKSSTGRDRIKAIHHLAGGNHRVYIIFSQFLTRDSLDDLVKPVMQTLDELTPYYQARMQCLSLQQRKIVELLCDRRHAVPVKEIAQRCFISHQTASSQLKDLLNKGYVVKETQGRESFYELLEPLMRICLETKKQRGEPIKLFVDFLRVWYTLEELRGRLIILPESCLEKEYIIRALEEHRQYNVSSGNFNKNDKYNLDTNWIKENLNKKLTPADSYLSYGSLLGIFGNYREALYYFDESLKLNPNNKETWFNRGLSLFNIGEFENSIKSFEKAIEFDPNNIDFWLGLGCSLIELEKYSNALNSFKRAIEIIHQTSENSNIDIKSLSCRAWNNHGFALKCLKKLDEAIISFEKAIKLQLDNKTAFYNRILALYDLGEYEKALTSFDRVVELYPEFIYAHFDRIETLLKLNRWKDGWKNLDSALESFANAENTYRGNVSQYIRIIWENNKSVDLCKSKLLVLVEIYEKYKLIHILDKGVTENIPNLLSEMVSNKAARTWLEVWQEVAGDKPELEIALRFLRTAVEYKETKEDSKVLLQLPKEERDLFVTLLKDVEG